MKPLMAEIVLRAEETVKATQVALLSTRLGLSEIPGMVMDTVAMGRMTVEVLESAGTTTMMTVTTGGGQVLEGPLAPTTNVPSPTVDGDA
jgi:hypothetical protein